MEVAQRNAARAITRFARREVMPDATSLSPHPATGLSARAVASARPALDAVTGLGRSVLVVGAVAWLGGWWLGWQELMLVAAGCLIAVVVSGGFTLGRAGFAVGVDLAPPRVVVGERAVARVVMTNHAGRRMLAARLELAVGSGVARIEFPALSARQAADELVVIPTTRRAVVAVGPARFVRGDPLGLVRREVELTGVKRLFVHPRTVRLPGVTAGWVRDLEGRPTKDLSNSDVAFHALREYAAGDDRRHIHWRSSARVGRLMVRQFVDTRRSRIGIVLTTGAAGYGDGDEFELAVSMVGSLGVSSLCDDLEVRCLSGSRPLRADTPTSLLDGLAGVGLGADDGDLTAVVRRAGSVVRGASVVVLVSGSGVTPAALLAAARRLGPDIRTIALRTELGCSASLHSQGSTSVLGVGTLDDLARLVRAVGVR